MLPQWVHGGFRKSSRLRFQNAYPQLEIGSRKEALSRSALSIQAVRVQRASRKRHSEPIMGTTELRSIFMSRTCVLLLLVVVSSPRASSKDKTKTLPAQVLHAQTILVVSSPDAGEPV